jgi:hypothetical protein
MIQYATYAMSHRKLGTFCVIPFTGRDRTAVALTFARHKMDPADVKPRT